MFAFFLAKMTFFGTSSDQLKHQQTHYNSSLPKIMTLKQNNGKFKSFKNGEEEEEEEDRRGSQQRNTIQHLNKQPERERQGRFCEAFLS